jgi:hypothetical protein
MCISATPRRPTSFVPRIDPLGEVMERLSLIGALRPAMRLKSSQIVFNIEI